VRALTHACTCTNARICTHIHAHTHAHAHAHAHKHTHIRTHTHTRTHAPTHTHTRMYAHAQVVHYERDHVRALTHAGTCTNARTCTHIHAHTHAHAHAHAHKHTHIRTHTHAHTHPHTHTRMYAHAQVVHYERDHAILQKAAAEGVGSVEGIYYQTLVGLTHDMSTMKQPGAQQAAAPGACRGCSLEWGQARACHAQHAHYEAAGGAAGSSSRQVRGAWRCAPPTSAHTQQGGPPAWPPLL